MKTRHGDYEKSVHFTVWSDFEVHVVFSNDLNASKRARYHCDGPGNASAFFTRGEGGHGHIFYKMDVAAETIAHEAWHAIHYMFEWAGVTEFDNETCAYHLGYLVGMISAFQAKVLGVKSSNTKRHHEQRQRC